MAKKKPVVIGAPYPVGWKPGPIIAQDPKIWDEVAPKKVKLFTCSVCGGLKYFDTVHTMHYSYDSVDVMVDCVGRRFARVKLLETK